MRVLNDTRLVTFHDWTLRVSPCTLRPARLLLLIHGWTGDENSMWVFVRNFPASYWIVAPRALHAARVPNAARFPNSPRSLGYSWRPPPTVPGQPPGLEDLRAPALALTELVDAYAAENDLKVDEFDAIGFSQGAALTNVIALLYPGRIRRAGVLAGFIPAGAETLIEQHRLAGKPFFVAHGTLDEMVKVEYARQSVRLLEQAGANVTFCEDQVGHRVSAGCLSALEAFFA